MTQPSAKIIADSINDWGQRLTTMEVVMHRFVLAEFNTHRVFSRNSASSRAIPYTKVSERVRTNVAWPVKWGQEQKGMQSGAEIENNATLISINNTWSAARDSALWCGDLLYGLGLHKSLINRMLEPFMWHTVIVTATEWDNFFWQRCHPDAQPEMKAAADEMQRAFFRSTPEHLTHGMWHLPYISKQDREEVKKMELFGPDAATHGAVTETLKKISTARCARVSYLTHDGKRDLMEDVGLFARLSESGHWSPFEHVATPVSFGSQFPLSNFRGWKQFRKEFPAENRAAFLPNLDDLADVRMRMEAGLVPWKGGSDA